MSKFFFSMKQETPIEEIKTPSSIINQVFDYIGIAALIVYSVSVVILIFRLIFPDIASSSSFLRENYPERISIVSLWLEIIAVLVSNNQRKRIINCIDWLDKKLIGITEQVDDLSNGMSSLQRNYEELTKVVDSFVKAPNSENEKQADEKIKQSIEVANQQRERIDNITEVMGYVNQVKRGLSEFNRMQNQCDSFKTDLYFTLVNKASAAVNYYRGIIGDRLTTKELQHCNLIKYLLNDYYKLYTVIETREEGISKLYTAIQFLDEMSNKLSSELNRLTT